MGVVVGVGVAHGVVDSSWQWMETTLITWNAGEKQGEPVSLNAVAELALGVCRTRLDDTKRKARR